MHGQQRENAYYSVVHYYLQSPHMTYLKHFASK